MKRLAIILIMLCAVVWATGAEAHGPKLKNKETASLASNRGPFELITHTGETVTDRDYLGKYMLVYFGYTNCPDVCPIDLQIVSEAVDMLGKDGARVQPLFVTVDPERDTVKVMADYVKHFHPRLIGLTGSKEQIASAANIYRMQSRKYFPADSEKKSDYLVEHSAAMVLIGPDGGGLSLFPHGITANDVVTDIKRFINPR
jgi:protein SCO1/2|tara:strand:- start:4584 stop:5186 length:603 start_codon:yes stop_codon:yes gene_type:complete